VQGLGEGLGEGAFATGREAIDGNDDSFHNSATKVGISVSLEGGSYSLFFNIFLILFKSRKPLYLCFGSNYFRFDEFLPRVFLIIHLINTRIHGII
jgi:hypothetical protein